MYPINGHIWTRETRVLCFGTFPHFLRLKPTNIITETNNYTMVATANAYINDMNISFNRIAVHNKVEIADKKE